MFLSVITWNLNWVILTKNLVTFKRWDGVKDEKFWYESLLKNPNLFLAGIKTNILGMNFPKKGGGLDSLQT